MSKSTSAANRRAREIDQRLIDEIDRLVRFINRMPHDRQQDGICDYCSMRLDQGHLPGCDWGDLLVLAYRLDTVLGSVMALERLEGKNG